MMGSKIGAEVRKVDRQILLPNGGEVTVRSADDPNSLRGEGLDFVVLDDTTVLLAADAPATAALLADRGLEVVTVDIGEFVKLEGCVTCLSIRLRP